MVKVFHDFLNSKKVTNIVKNIYKQETTLTKMSF